MTINGIGTMYYGWKAHPDGSATATWWIVVVFLPLIPLRRERLRIYSPGADNIALPATGQTAWQIVERLPLDWTSILLTYFKGFIIVPAILIGPIVLAVLGVKFGFQKLQMKVPEYVIGIGAFAAIVYCAVVIAYILDVAKGPRDGQLGRDS